MGEAKRRREADDPTWASDRPEDDKEKIAHFEHSEDLRRRAQAALQSDANMRERDGRKKHG